LVVNIQDNGTNNTMKRILKPPAHIIDIPCTYISNRISKAVYKGETIETFDK